MKTNKKNIRDRRVKEESQRIELREKERDAGNNNERQQRRTVMDQEDTSIVHTRSRDRELEQGLRGRKYCIREKIQLQRRDVMTDRKRRQVVQVVLFFFLSISSFTSKSNISVSILCAIPAQVRTSRMMHTCVWVFV